MITQGERKLAAIMFSDIQGYTRIMEDNERQGLSMAKRYRETLEKLAFEHGGEVVQNYGDGSLSVFGSAVNAVNCAIALQHLMMSAESIPLRIGLHLGDIVVEDDDIYGAGVNLASRIESMGVAGNILVSESICKELRNHDEITHVSLGKFDFKNVEEPIEVHAISNPGITVPRRSELSGKFREKTRIQPRLKVAGIIALIGAGLWLAYDVFMTGPLIDSLAVLPLTAQTRSEDEALLLAGVHDGLINSLGQLGEIKVISKLSTLAYAGSAKSPGEIADELDVQGVITGNVHYHGDTLDINLDLVKAGRSKKSLWSRVYRSEVSDVMNLYNVVRQDLARGMRIETTDQETERSPRKMSPETQKAYLRGMHWVNKSTPDDILKGIEFLKEAVENDPADPWAYVGLAQGYAWLGHGPDPEEQFWKLGKAAAERALSIDSTIADAHTILAVINLYYQWDYTAAEQGFIKALSINPNLALAHFHYAWYLVTMGQFQKAVEHHLLSKELDPLLPIYTSDMGSMYLWVGDIDRAMKEAQLGLRLDSSFAHGWWVLGNVHVAKGNFDEAIEAHLKASNVHPAWRGALGGTYAIASKKVEARSIIKDLEQGEITPRTAFWLAYIYMNLGEYDSMYKWLAFRPADPWLMCIGMWPEYRPLRKDPLFRKFLEESNIPIGEIQ